MRKDAYLFLVLIVAAAVITGSTIGLASNFDLIAANYKGHPPQEQSIQIAELDKSVENISSPDAKCPTPVTTPSLETVTSPSLENDLVINSEEELQVIAMLMAVGMIDTNDYGSFIKEFQTEHTLNPTGNLDAPTFNLIIEQMRCEKASRALDNN